MNASMFAGFVVLALSPSFLDWQQSPEKRAQIIGYYAVAALLFLNGRERR